MSTSSKSLTLIDANTLRSQLDALIENQNGKDIAVAVRPAIVSLLKKTIQEGQNNAEALLEKNGKGRSEERRVGKECSVACRSRGARVP